MRMPLCLPELAPEGIAELDQFYRTTHDVRLCLGIIGATSREPDPSPYLLRS
jgi:hypothetical protein